LAMADQGEGQWLPHGSASFTQGGEVRVRQWCDVVMWSLYQAATHVSAWRREQRACACVKVVSAQVHTVSISTMFGLLVAEAADTTSPANASTGTRNMAMSHQQPVIALFMITRSIDFFFLFFSTIEQRDDRGPELEWGMRKRPGADRVPPVRGCPE
jgi:hypothetical protein